MCPDLVRGDSVDADGLDGRVALGRFELLATGGRDVELGEAVGGGGLRGLRDPDLGGVRVREAVVDGAGPVGGILRATALQLQRERE